MLHTQTTAQEDTLTPTDLDNFHGCDQFFHLPYFKQFVYTEGVQYIAEKGGAYWLLDKIFACQSCIAKLTHEPFTTWTLTKNAAGQGARFVCSDGNDNELYAENILHTDFPLQSITLWLTDKTLLLPSEY